MIVESRRASQQLVQMGPPLPSQTKRYTSLILLVFYELQFEIPQTLHDGVP